MRLSLDIGAAAVSALLFLALLSPATAQAADKPAALLTGDKFNEQLQRSVGVEWENIPLRRALNSLSQAQAVAVLLDRRVDPDENLDLSVKDVSLLALLKMIAEKRKIGVGIVGSTVYLGPTATAEKVRTAAALRKQEAQQLKPAVSARYLAEHPLKWDDATAPRDLLTALADEAKISIDGQDRVPHDLWAGATIPRSSLIDRLTLVAAQFDLTFEFVDGGARVRLADMPDKASIEKHYTLPAKQVAQGDQLLKDIDRLAPSADTKLTGSSLVVRGRAEDQDLVETLLAGKAAKTTTIVGGQQVYTISVAMPVGNLVKALGKRLDLTVEFDEPAINAAGLSLTKEVKLDVKKVSQDELLAAALAPAKLTFEHKGSTIIVRPK